jgi:hypothetical protein
MLLTQLIDQPFGLTNSTNISDAKKRRSDDMSTHLLMHRFPCRRPGVLNMNDDALKARIQFHLGRWPTSPACPVLGRTSECTIDLYPQISVPWVVASRAPTNSSLPCWVSNSEAISGYSANVCPLIMAENGSIRGFLLLPSPTLQAVRKTLL